MEIAVPKSNRQEIDTIVALELDTPAMGIPPIAVTSNRPLACRGKPARASNVYQNNPDFAAAKACRRRRRDALGHRCQYRPVLAGG